MPRYDDWKPILVVDVLILIGATITVGTIILCLIDAFS